MDGDLILPPRPAPGAVLDRLMPMHLILDAAGRITSHGPTLNRLFAGRSLVGQAFLDLFDLRSPNGLTAASGFAAAVGHKLRLSPRGEEAAALRLRGVLLPASVLSEAPGWVVNLSFGIDLPRAVALLQLTDADFAPTDLAMEMLYLVEANKAVTGELHGLALRLDGARRQAREEAETDTLTGLRNRRACDSVLGRLCREGRAFALMHMDLDYFKAVNDTLGHAAGDHVLAHVAGVMKAASRSDDCLARVGGDEFVMVLPEIDDPSRIRAIGERLIAQINHPIPWQGSDCRVSASVGFCLVPPDTGVEPASVLARADEALYAAKKAGRGCVRQAEPWGPPGAEGSVSGPGAAA